MQIKKRTHLVIVLSLIVSIFAFVVPASAQTEKQPSVVEYKFPCNINTDGNWKKIRIAKGFSTDEQLLSNINNIGRTLHGPNRTATDFNNQSWQTAPSTSSRIYGICEDAKVIAARTGKLKLLTLAKDGGVYIEHPDGQVSFYAHLSSSNYTTKDYGKEIKVGDVIGIMGKMGVPAGNPAHIHLAIGKFDTKGYFQETLVGLNPWKYVLSLNYSPLLAPVKHPRLLADVNGDGKADIVGFGDNDVYVSLSTGSGFGAPQSRINTAFTYNNGGWRVEKHVRTMADVNGDGKADIVGFGDNDVYVSLSTGSGFGAPQSRINTAFTYNNGGWHVEKHVRTMADVNGDGKADIVGFGDNDVYVSLSTGSGFGAPQSWINTAFTYNNGGWRVEKHVRVMADVNGDGKADIVGFGDNDVYVSLSSGLGFGAPQSWINTAFTYNNGGWRIEKHVRVMADVNGDGKADIVGFGDNDVYVSLSSGSGFGVPQSRINTAFTYNNGGWRNEKHIRTLKDVNGDGKADIVGFGDNDVYISLSTSSTFSTPHSWINAYVYNIGGWR